MGRMILILGGARSGKSGYAKDLAERLAGGTQGAVTFVATAEAGDAEMAERIQRHRQERPAHWQTVEAPLLLPQAVGAAGASAEVVLVDCLTLWLTNLLLQAGDDAAPAREEAVLAEVDALSAAARGVPAHVLLVANEVGLGLVPPTPLGRAFRDVAGRANQRLARSADEVYMVWAGLPQLLKGSPR